MELVKQRAFGECGPACLSMLTGYPLSQIVDGYKAIDVDVRKDGLDSRQMMHYLDYIGFGPTRETLNWDEKSVAVLTVPSLNTFGVLHYIVWDGSRYLDPSTGPATYPDDARDGTVPWACALLVGDRYQSDVSSEPHSLNKKDLGLALAREYHWLAMGTASSAKRLGHLGQLSKRIGLLSQANLWESEASESLRKHGLLSRLETHDRILDKNAGELDSEVRTALDAKPDRS